jgi:hypothetical protein
VNCTFPLVVVVVLFGEMPTLIVEPAAVMVTVATAVLLESATLVATIEAVPAVDGAV